MTYLPGRDRECVIHSPFRCGLVALWMSAHLRQPQLSVDMETVVQTALNRGYTAQGEMFSGNRGVETRAKRVCISVIMDHPFLFRGR